MSSDMFRTTALKRIASPEQLDRAVRVTLPRQWLALAVLILLVLTGVAWSTVANVPTTVSALGYYLPQGGLEEIESPIRGTVESVAIRPGAQAAFGRVVMTIKPA